MLSLKDECPKIQCVSFRCPEHCTYQGITQQRQLLKRQDCRARASNKIKTNNISNKIEKKTVSGVFYVIIPAFACSK